MAYKKCTLSEISHISFTIYDTNFTYKRTKDKTKGYICVPVHNPPHPPPSLPLQMGYFFFSVKLDKNQKKDKKSK